MVLLGRLIGFGGAEYRLAPLIGPFHFHALVAVILNKGYQSGSCGLRAAEDRPLFDTPWLVPVGQLVGFWCCRQSSCADTHIAERQAEPPILSTRPCNFPPLAAFGRHFSVAHPRQSNSLTFRIRDPAYFNQGRTL